jgi:hypothetical protein
MPKARTASKNIRVFLASPGDLAPERKVFKDQIDELNKGFADGMGIEFVPLGWEDVLATTGRRPQDVINREVDECDLFVLALHRRWGQKAPDSKYSSYTEEEFYRAITRWKKSKSPEVLVFFKDIDNGQMADPGPELTKVLAFRKKLEQGRETLYKRFASETQFGVEIDSHLRAFARGEWKDVSSDAGGVTLEKKRIDAVDRSARKLTERMSGKGGSKARGKVSLAQRRADVSLVKAETEALTLARAAADMAAKGDRESARILFAKATEGTTNLSILSLAADFARQTGDIDTASDLVKRHAAIARDRTVAAQHYMSLLPPNMMKMMQEQMLDQMLSAFPPELVPVMQALYNEVYGDGKLERLMLDTMIKYYTTEELLMLAKYMVTPEAQSMLHKQPLMMKELMDYGMHAMQEAIERHAAIDAESVVEDETKALPPPAAPAEPTRKKI